MLLRRDKMKKVRPKKENKNKESKFIRKIKEKSKIIILALISVVALIIGSFTIGFISTVILLVIAGLIYYFITKPKKKTKRSVKEVLKTVLIFCFSFAIFFLIVAVGFASYIILTAPEFNAENLYNKDASILYNSDGTEMAKIGAEIRQKVTYDELSQDLIDAIIATEDSRFFQHSGVDLPRFLKASISQLLGKGGGGASTLTMQVSKNAFTSNEDEGLEGIIRKFTDVYLSVFKIETHYTKEQIIEFYVNSNNLGSSNRGVEQASQDYFGKSASELNLAEAAMIAGLFQAPGAYNPYLYPEACEGRRIEVLNLMLRHGYITEEEYNIAKELTVEELLTHDSDEVSSDAYQDFIDTVVEEVIKRTGNDPYAVPMKIYTTMDKEMQETMAGVMNGTLYEWKDEYVQGASIVIDVENGEIKAVGGGRDRVVRGENLATDINRQIGSSAKPLYDYGPGIEYNNWSTYTPFTDEPYSYSDGISIKNWDSSYYYFQTLHDALKYSRNIPAVKAFQQVENSNIKEFVTNLGLSPEVANNGLIYESHALGGYNGESPLTMAAAYAAFSNGGYYIEPHSFTRIEYIDSGETYEVKPITRRAMSEETAYMITKVLEDTSGYAVGLSVNGVNYAAKTGTTNLDSQTISDYDLPRNAISDKWIASFNDSYAIAVWYGYKYLDKEHCLTTSDYSIKRVFQAIAKSVYTERSTWEQPDGVVKVVVEDELPNAMLASEFTPKDQQITAYFKKGFEPTQTSTRYSQLENVTSLNYDSSTNTLSWQPIATPDFIDTDYLANIFDQLYTDEKTKESELNKRINYNNQNIGSVVYDIYVKDSSGNLTLLTTTTNNSFIYPVTETTTFVVKSAYSIFKDNASSGAEFTIEKDSSTIISSEINGSYTVTLSVGQQYVEPDKPVIVLENGITDVTDLATITYTVRRNSDNQVFSSVSYINTNAADSYTITYYVSYGSYQNTLTKIVQIQ